ncbi:hypothetical protein D3C86_1648110 [compost metagenome]
MALAHRAITDPGGDHRQQPQGMDQSQQRDQYKPAKHDPDNPPQSVERHHRADIPTDPLMADAQAQGQGESGAEHQRRYEDNAQCRDCKPRAHPQQLAGAQRQHPAFGQALGDHQPASQHCNFQQCDQPGAGDQ